MPVEIEAKLKVDDLEMVRVRLRAVDAILVGKYLETNLFFDTDDRSLLAADEGLRLRTTAEIDGPNQQVTITYKGPRQHGQLKSRDETEVVVGSLEDSVTLLERLGFHRVLTFEKRRETWKLDGCKVELDELPHLGFFVEIEGPREDVVLATREKLKLADRPIVKASYIAMLMTHLQEQAITTRRVTFAAPGKSA